MKRVRQFKCNKSSDNFCYICGLFVPIANRRSINELVRNHYSSYFAIEIQNQDACWVPHSVCSSCKLSLDRWSRNAGHMNFGRPMMWRDPVNHETNCYICLTDVVGLSGRKRHNVKYATVNSVSLPVPHSEDLPIPLSPFMDTPELPDDEEGDEEIDVCFVEDRPEIDDPLYIPDTEQPHPLTQGDLNDLVRDLYLTKSASELLASRLQQWSLLARG